MDWFTDIPKFVLLCFAVLTAIGTLTFIVNMDSGSSGQPNENLDKFTEYVTDNVVPTEISWISLLADKLSNHPFLLFGSVVAVLWLFGYFLPKDA